MFADLQKRFAHRDRIQQMVDQCIAGHQYSILDATDPSVGTREASHGRGGEQRAHVVQQR